MGLKEKRAIAELQAKLPQWTEQIKTASKGIITSVEVNWDTLAVEDQSQNYEAWEQIFIKPIVMTLDSICADKMGQDSLKAKYKKVKIQNVKDCHYGEGSIEFSGDSIVLDHSLSNVDYWEDSAKAWISAIENTL